jgi:hypothetical protein
MRDSFKSYTRVLSNSVKRRFYLTCSENNIEMPSRRSGRVDPVLKLYADCPLMYTQNSDVLRGQANGTRVSLLNVHIKTGEQPFDLQLSSGVRIRAFMASQVKHISVKHENSEMQPSVFHVEAKSYTFSAKMKIDSTDPKPSVLSMKGNQFGLISNSVTTGHKLQGYTALFLLVLDWVFKSNWVYTVLSRVRTMAGLYMLQPLSEVLEKFEMSENMKQMLHRFRSMLPLKVFTEDEYDDMLQQVERRVPTINST